MSNRCDNLFISVGMAVNVTGKDELLAKSAYQLAGELRQLDLDNAPIELIASNQGISGIQGGESPLVKDVELSSIPNLIAILQSWLSHNPQQTIDLQIGENKVQNVLNKMVQPSCSGVYAIGDIIKIAPSIEGQTIADDVQSATTTPQPLPTIHPVSNNISRPF